MDELKESISSLEDFYDLISDGIVITNLNGKINYVNASACNLMKCKTKSSFKNDSIESCFVNPKLFPSVLENLTTSNSFIEKQECKKKDGTKEIFVICFSMILNSISKPIGLQIIFKNPKSSEDSHLIFESRSSILRTLNYQSKEVIIISDLKNQKNIFCSQSIENILGWTQKDFIDGGWAFALSLTHPDFTKSITDTFRTEIESRFKKELSSLQKPIVYEYKKRHKNGTWLWIHTESIVLDFDKKNQPVFIISFLKDVTNLKNHSEQSNGEFERSVTKELEDIFIPSKTDKKHITVQLSKREKEILQLIKDGLSAKEIADILGLKITSVNSYKKNLMNKLQAKNSAELVQKSNEFSIN